MELFYIRSPIRSFSSQINRFSRIVSQVGDKAASPVPSTGAASMRNLRIALTKEVAAPPLPQRSKERQKASWPSESTNAAAKDLPGNISGKVSSLWCILAYFWQMSCPRLALLVLVVGRRKLMPLRRL